jgi:hypothetical protein
MKTMYSLILVAAIAIPAAASAQTAPAADATGTWSASFNTQNGTIPATLTFKKSGDKITGTLASDQGSTDLEAEIKGKALTVWFNYNANGQSIPIEMSGTIDGDTAKGTMTAGGSPAGDWTATRSKDAKDAKDKDSKDKDSKDTKAPSSSATTSLTGDWSVTLQLDQINATPALTLKQDGEKLTGTYTSQQYGKFPLTGTVKGKDVTFAVTLNIEGNSMAANYTGTVQDDGSIKGAVDIGGMMSGSWSATRAK